MSPSLRRQFVALLVVLLTGAPTSAADGVVQIDCPQLSREQGGELESRVRANLLTADVTASVAITCGVDSIAVRASAGSDSTSRRITTTPASLLDDVMQAVDEVLQELASRQRITAVAPATQPLAPKAPEEPPKAAESPTPVAAQVASQSNGESPPGGQPRPASSIGIELFASFVGEAWASQLAGGVLLGLRRGRAPFWYGLRGGALRPFTQDAQFGLTELSLAAEAQFAPEFSRGVRLGVAVGPSWLLVAPHADLTARDGTDSISLSFDVELSRPFSLGAVELVPSLGGRWFTNERGVRIDGHERFALGGFTPRLALGLLYRTD
ncbi:MAG TPA: hypothetical protein VIW29_15695 [Polyangiaceae bacterium]